MKMPRHDDRPVRSGLISWAVFVVVFLSLSLAFGDGVPWFSLAVITVVMALMTWYFTRRASRRDT